MPIPSMYGAIIPTGRTNSLNNCGRQEPGCLESSPPYLLSLLSQSSSKLIHSVSSEMNQFDCLSIEAKQHNAADKPLDALSVALPMAFP